YPVKVRGVVTCEWKDREHLFVSDSTGGIGLSPWTGAIRDAAGNPAQLRSGDFVEVTGVTRQGGYAPVVKDWQVTILGKGTFPRPLHHSLQHMLTGIDFNQWVEVGGIVRSVEGNDLDLMLEEGPLVVSLKDLAPNQKADLHRLVDAATRVRGI